MAERKLKPIKAKDRAGLRQGGKSWGRQAGEEQEEEERFFDSVTKILLKGKKL